MSIADDLEKLVSLRDNGILNEDEFQASKAKVLAKIRTTNSEQLEEQQDQVKEILKKYSVNEYTKNNKNIKEDSAKESNMIFFKCPVCSSDPNYIICPNCWAVEKFTLESKGGVCDCNNSIESIICHCGANVDRKFFYIDKSLEKEAIEDARIYANNKYAKDNIKFGKYYWNSAKVMGIFMFIVYYLTSYNMHSKSPRYNGDYAIGAIANRAIEEQNTVNDTSLFWLLTLFTFIISLLPAYVMYKLKISAVIKSRIRRI